MSPPRDDWRADAHAGSLSDVDRPAACNPLITASSRFSSNCTPRPLGFHRPLPASTNHTRMSTTSRLLVVHDVAPGSGRGVPRPCRSPAERGRRSERVERGIWLQGDQWRCAADCRIWIDVKVVERGGSGSLRKALRLEPVKTVHPNCHRPPRTSSGAEGSDFAGLWQGSPRLVQPSVAAIGR
jgi:hypothetical protein